MWSPTSSRTGPRGAICTCWASDGLTRELTNGEIAEILRRLVPTPEPTPHDLQSACHELICAANQNGGRDNITVLLLALL